jgi:hypothetical protein
MRYIRTPIIIIIIIITSLCLRHGVNTKLSKQFTFIEQVTHLFKILTLNYKNESSEN